MFEHVNMARSHQGEQKWILWMEGGKQESAPDQGEASGGKEARHTGTGGQRLLIRPAPDLNWLTLPEAIEAAETQKGSWSSLQGGKDVSPSCTVGGRASSSQWCRCDFLTYSPISQLYFRKQMLSSLFS